MSSRLTRKEIKRDEVLETLGGFVGFLSRHGRSLLIGGVALVVVAIGALIWIQVRAARAERSSEALAEAVELLEGSAEAGVVRARLEEVRKRYAGTDAADLAAVYLADLAAGEGDLEGARALWQEFLDAQGDNLLAVQVRVNRMAVDRALGRGEEVAAELEAMVDDEEAPLPQPVALYQLAVTLESLGRADAARDAYERVADEHAASPLAAEAERRAERLGAALSG
ncbi:MAG: tetratricopeptide repeat protein [Thermoanaerobaculia bacterium]|nr:tetratricopeptide repeat protein [Thermoanaerobaculia bacterium]